MGSPGNIKRRGSQPAVNKNERLRLSTKVTMGLKPGTIGLKAVSPRPEHSATVAAEVTHLLVYPVDRANYSNPLFPSGGSSNVKESKPVQATDHETDTLYGSMIAINIPAQHKSIFESNLQDRNRPSSNLYTSSQHLSERRQTYLNSSSELAQDATAYIPKPARYPDYVYIANRNLTFQSRLWDVNNKPDIRTLTEYGFFYTGTADLVRCFQCGIGLKDFVKTDDVLAEHVKHSSSCDFLRQKVGRTALERLKFSLSVPADIANGDNQTASNSYRIRSPRYQTMDARMASFSTFPSHIQIQHRTLAVAGLYYTGTGDLCRCFACDGGLKDWSTGDDPLQEHATYFPKCPYINQLKGQEYVTQMQSRRTNSDSTGTLCSGTASQALYNQGAISHGKDHAGNDQGTLALETCKEAASQRNDSLTTMSQVSQSFGALSMDKRNIENYSSSVMTSQVFQQLGYTELDVATARAELERKGNKSPTSEDIVNIILDIKERTSQSAESSSTGDNSTELKEMLEENERLSEIVHCKLCVTGEPDILFLPCAHHKICHNCAENLTHCPLCQKQIKQKIKTYRS